MKKIVLISLIGLSSVLAYGQLGFGFKGALSMNKLSTDISDYKESLKAGYQVGAFVRIGEKLHLQPEIYFAVKNYKTTSDWPSDISNPGSSEVSVKQDLTLSTLDIPVLIGVRIIKLPTLNIRLQAGPVGSVILNKKLSIDHTGISEEQKTDIEETYKNMNWGAQFGAGIDFLFLTADVRYELGLNDITKAPDASVSTYLPDEIKNNVFFISVGWKIK